MPTESEPEQSSPPTQEPQPVVDLLGGIAYAGLSAFTHTAALAEQAPTIAMKAAIAGLAAGDHDRYTAAAARLTLMQLRPDRAMATFAPPIDAFHRRTEPADFAEGVVKAFVDQSIAVGFCDEVAEVIDPGLSDVVPAMLIDSARAEFLITCVHEVITADPSAKGRLTLWARRVLGEALSHAQRVVADRPDLAALVTGSEPDSGLGETAEFLSRLTARHATRMESLGL